MAYSNQFFSSADFNPISNFNPLAFGETEEERLRREEQERRQREAMLVAGPISPPQQPGPVKQTVTFDPRTGEQRMKIEGSVQDLSAANPLTPTVSMPTQSVAGPMAPGVGPTPDELMREQEQRRQYALMMAQPAAPVAPPAGPVQMAAAPAATMTDVTAPTTGEIPPGMARNPETGEFYTPVPAMGAPAPVGLTESEVLPGFTADPRAAGENVSSMPVAPAPATPVSPDQQYMYQDIQEGPVMQQFQAEPAAANFNYFNIIRAAQNDPAAMERIARDPNTPEQWRRVAADQSRMTLEQKRDRELAEAEARQLISSGSPRARRELRRESDEGSMLKLAMYEFLLGPQSNLAKLEANKLSMTWDQETDSAGNRVLIQRRGDGKPVRGIDSQGNEIAQDQLMMYAGGGASKLKPEVGGAYVKKDDQGKIIARGVRTTSILANGKTRTVIESGGRTYNINEGWEPETISTAAEKTQAQEAIRLRYTGPISYTKASAEAAAKFNFDNKTNMGYSSQEPGSPLLDLNTGQPIVPAADGTIIVTRRAAGAAAPTAGVTPTAGGLSPAEITSQRELNKTMGTEFIKINAANASEEAKKSSQASSLLRTVDSVIRFTETRPDFFNALQSPAYRAFAAAQGPEATARLKELSDAVRIQEKDRPAFNELMNDIKRLEVAGITQSGLTASQLNTQVESQRVINQFAVDTANTPQAARIQAEIAKATIEYQREYARYLGRADLTQNPAKIRNDFDKDFGNKIWEDLKPKLEAIRRGGVVDFRSKS